MEKWERLEKEKDFKRNIILDASKSLFLEKGFEHTTIDEIAAKCGFAKGSIYNYFSSKQDIIESLLIEFKEFSATEVKKIVNEKIPCSKKIAKLVDFFYEISLKNPKKIFEKFFKDNNNLVLFVKDVFTKISTHEEDVLEDISKIIEEGIAIGEFSNNNIDPKIAASLLLYYSKGVLLYIWLYDSTIDDNQKTKKLNPTVMMKSHVDFILRSLKNS